MIFKTFIGVLIIVKSVKKLQCGCYDLFTISVPLSNDVYFGFLHYEADTYQGAGGKKTDVVGANIAARHLNRWRAR